MTAQDAPGPLSRPFRVDRLSNDRAGITVEATQAEAKALAEDFKIPAIRDLVGRFTWSGTPASLLITGTVQAVVTQICTVTLDPFESEIVEPVEVAFTDTDRLQGTDAEAEDVPDPIVGGRIDLGRITAEFLALALDPYPRKPGVTFDPIEDSDASPLAVLRTLRFDGT